VNPGQYVNPYIAGSPVTGTEMFYGREDVFSFIQRNLIGRHRDTPIVLYGQRRTGKTSVLYQLHRHLDPGYRCIFIDLHGLNLQGMGNLLLGIASSINRGLRRDHQLAVELPDRGAFLADPRSAFETMFLDRVWSALSEDHLVLMMDEAVRLDEEVRAGRLERDIFDYLRHLMQHYPRLNFIFSLGSGLEEMAKDYAFLFSVSLYHRISFLEQAAAGELITQPVRDHYQVAPEAVSKILQITSGHPYYTQLVCHCMFDLWSRAPKPVMDLADVDAVLAEAIELGSANLTYVWEDSTPGEQAVMAGMATAMRRRTSPVTIDHARDAWRQVDVSLPERETARALRSLTSREVLRSLTSREGLAGTQAYSFNVDLQRLWLEQHRHLEWVKDELAETVQQWNRSAEPWPADAIPGQTSGPVPASAEGATNGREPEKASAGAKPRLTRRSRYLATAAAVVALASYLVAAAAAHVFPFSNSTQGVTSVQNLVQLLPGDPIQNEHECHAAPPPGQWSMPGLVQTVHCADPHLPGGNIYAYQLDSAADFQTAWRNFNQWWKFLPAGAETTCPPTGVTRGVVNLSNPALPEADRQVLECGMQMPNRYKMVPAYALSFPTNDAFVIAQGAASTSFTALNDWLIRNPSTHSG
jgi:AAA domain